MRRYLYLSLFGIGFFVCSSIVANCSRDAALAVPEEFSVGAQPYLEFSKDLVALNHRKWISLSRLSVELSAANNQLVKCDAPVLVFIEGSRADLQSHFGSVVLTDWRTKPSKLLGLTKPVEWTISGSLFMKLLPQSHAKWSDLYGQYHVQSRGKPGELFLINQHEVQIAIPPSAAQLNLRIEPEENTKIRCHNIEVVEASIAT
jgi:hypothetical protein